MENFKNLSDYLIDNINNDNYNDNDSNSDSDNNYEQFEQSEEESMHINCINIGLNYFSKLYKKEKMKMFDGINIDDELSTNRFLENIYESMYTYKLNLETNDKLCDIYNIEEISKYLNENEYDELYGLSNDGKIDKVSPTLFSIITYIAHNTDWKNNNSWLIIPLKNLNH